MGKCRKNTRKRKEDRWRQCLGQGKKGESERGAAGKLEVQETVNGEDSFCFSGSVYLSIPYMSNGNLGTSTPNDAGLPDGLRTSSNLVSPILQEDFTGKLNK